MKKLILAAVLSIVGFSNCFSAPPYEVVVSTSTNRAEQRIGGNSKYRNSSNVQTVLISGDIGNITAANINASSATFVSSVTASSFFGDGSNLSKVNISSSSAGYFRIQTDALGDTWLTQNAYFDGSHWQRINIAQPSWGLQMQSSGTIPGEIEYNPGFNIWRAVSGPNPIGSFGSYGGWELSWLTTYYRDLVAGGGSIELDGAGTFPYGRIIHYPSWEGATHTGITQNAYDALNGRDSDDYPSWFVGFADDTFVIKRAPVSPYISFSTLTLVDAYGDMAVLGNFNGGGYITSTSSMTASAFFGDGSHLTGIVNTSVAGGELSGNYPNPILATSQTSSHTWTSQQTYSNTVVLNGSTISSDMSIGGVSAASGYPFRVINGSAYFQKGVYFTTATINGIPYTFPASIGSGPLVVDGSGNLSWDSSYIKLNNYYSGSLTFSGSTSKLQLSTVTLPSSISYDGSALDIVNGNQQILNSGSLYFKDSSLTSLASIHNGTGYYKYGINFTTATINGVSYTFPSSNTSGAAFNDGSGGISWDGSVIRTGYNNSGRLRLVGGGYGAGLTISTGTAPSTESQFDLYGDQSITGAIYFKNGNNGLSFGTDIGSIKANSLGVVHSGTQIFRNTLETDGFSNIKSTTVISGYADGNQNSTRLYLSGGLRAGIHSTSDLTGGVEVINTDGKIPAISSTYFASTDGSNLSNVALLNGNNTFTGNNSFSVTNTFNAKTYFLDNLVAYGPYYGSYQMLNSRASSASEVIGEIDWLQSTSSGRTGTGMFRIMGYGTTHATQPNKLIIDASSTNTSPSTANVVLGGPYTSSVTVAVPLSANSYINAIGSITANSGFFGDGSGISNVVIVGSTAGGDLSGSYPNPVLNAAQTGAHTWSAAQTFNSLIRTSTQTINGTVSINPQSTLSNNNKILLSVGNANISNFSQQWIDIANNNYDSSLPYDALAKGLLWETGDSERFALWNSRRDNYGTYLHLSTGSTTGWTQTFHDVAVFSSDGNMWLPNGNLGIGISTTTSPSTALQVAGTVTATAFSGSASGLTGDVIVGTSAGGDLSGTYPNPTLATMQTGAHTWSATQTFTKTIIGNISGNAGTVTNGIYTTTAAGGDLSGTYPNPVLATTAVTAGTYGSASLVPVFSVDAKGRITGVTNTAVNGGSPTGTAGGELSGSYPNPVLAATQTGTHIWTANQTVSGSNSPGLITANVSSGYGSIALAAAGTTKLNVGYAASAANFGSQTRPGEVSFQGPASVHFALGGGNPATVMFISSNGVVGLGTTTPEQKLDVHNGNISTNYGLIASTGVFTTPSGYVDSAGITITAPDIGALQASSAYGIYSTASSGWAGYFQGTTNGIVAVSTMSSGIPILAYGGNSVTNDLQVWKRSSTGSTVGTMSHDGNLTVSGLTSTYGISTSSGVFTNTVKIGGASNIGISPGLLVLVSSGSFSSATTASVAIPSQYTDFYVVARLTNASGSGSKDIGLTFDNSSGSYYGDAGYAYASTGPLGWGCSGSTNKLFKMSNVSDVGSGAYISYSSNVHIMSGSLLSLNGTISYFNNDGNVVSAFLGGVYTGTTPTNMQIFVAPDSGSCSTALSPTANGITGVVYVFAMPF